MTARGPWYDVSWKGSEERSGGLVTNIGIHLFDLLLWMFGPMRRSEVSLRDPRRVSGVIELDSTALAMLLDGIDVRSVRRGKTWNPATSIS